MTTDLIFLLQTFVIVTVPFALSRVLRLSGMVPLVVIQILFGIALGPSLFGRIAPETYGILFNPATLGPLSGAASIAVLFFGFITGLHIDADTFRGKGGAFAAIAAASVIVPTGLGVLGGLLIGIRHPAELGARGDLFAFASAIGLCLGVTALPVLGAILREMGLLGGRIAGVALGIAAVSDAALWLFLGGLMTAAGEGAPEQPGLLLPLLALPIYFLLMARVVRPLLARAVAAFVHDGTMGEAALVVVGASAIGSAVITEILGLHYIFGAFLAGAIVPRELRRSILDRLQVMTIGVLMPFFFMLSGLRTWIDPSSAAFLEILLVTTVLGVVGKVGGTALIAVFVGETWSSALCLGTLAQTKGLMEVVVLAVLLEHGIISSTAFSALTLMAVISTAFVVPLSRLLLSRMKSEAGFERHASMLRQSSPRRAPHGIGDMMGSRVGAHATRPLDVPRRAATSRDGARHSPDRPPRVLLAVPESDAHVVANRLLEYFLKRRGCTVLNLGACTPAADIATSARDFGPDAVIISSQNGHAFDDLRSLPEAMAAAGVVDVPVYLGGNLSVGADKPLADNARFRLLGIRVVTSFDGLEEVLRLPRTDE